MSLPGRCARAFTIIELVIVLAVLGLIVGVAAPRFGNSSAGAQARNATRGLVDALTAQRAETIRSMAPTRLFLVSGGADPGSTRLIMADEEEASGDTLTAMLAIQSRIDEPFRALGVWKGAVLDPGTGTETQRNAWEVRSVRIDPTGRASIEGGRTSLALVASRGGDTIWRIQFDPISGVPTVRSESADRGLSSTRR